MSKKAIVSSETLGFVLDDLSKSLGTRPGCGLIEGFESVTGITGSTDVTGISTDVDHKGIGSLSVEFDKSGTTQAYAFIDKTLDSIDIEKLGINGSIVWFIYLSALTDIANVRLYLGTSSSHCIYWQTADTSLSVGWNILVQDIKSPTAVIGNGINLSNITFIRAYVGFDAVGDTLNDIRVDSVVVVSTESIVGTGGISTESTLLAIKDAVKIMEDWDESDRAKVNVNLNAGVAVDIGAGNANVGTARVTISSDQTALPVKLNDKSSQAVGTQQINVDNVSNVYLGEIDLADASWHDFTLQVSIVQNPGDESAWDFILFWGFCSSSLTTSAPTQLATSEYSLVCDLTSGGTTRYYMTSVLQPKARYLSIWYDCNNLTVPIASVDVVLNKVT